MNEEKKNTTELKRHRNTKRKRLNDSRKCEFSEYTVHQLCMYNKKAVLKSWICTLEPVIVLHPWFCAHKSSSTNLMQIVGNSGQRHVMIKGLKKHWKMQAESTTRENTPHTTLNNYASSVSHRC